MPIEDAWCAEYTRGLYRATRRISASRQRFSIISKRGGSSGRNGSLRDFVLVAYVDRQKKIRGSGVSPSVLGTHAYSRWQMSYLQEHTHKLTESRYTSHAHKSEESTLRFHQIGQKQLVFPLGREREGAMLLIPNIKSYRDQHWIHRIGS